MFVVLWRNRDLDCKSKARCVYFQYFLEVGVGHRGASTNGQLLDVVALNIIVFCLGSNIIYHYLFPPTAAGSSHRKDCLPPKLSRDVSSPPGLFQKGPCCPRSRYLSATVTEEGVSRPGLLWRPASTSCTLAPPCPGPGGRRDNQIF